MPITEMSKANIGIYSFSGDTKSPVANIEFELNSFRDPLGNIHLRKQCVDGTDPIVQVWIKVDPRYPAILNQSIILAKDHFQAGGKWLSIGFRDFHGLWISRAVATLIAGELAQLGYNVGVLHARGQE